MTKSKFRLSLVILTAVLLLCSVLLFAVKGSSANAELSITGLQEEYFVGEEITVPNAEFKISDQDTIDADSHVVIFPNGKSYQDNKITLTEYGKYTIKYFAEHNSQKYEEQITFDVYSPLYEVIGGGNCQYGNVSGFEGETGVNVALKDGDVFRINKKIDLFGKTKKDNLISLSITPLYNNFYEFERIFVKFIDVSNPDKFVTIAARHFTDLKDRLNKSYVLCFINDDVTEYDYEDIIHNLNNGGTRGTEVDLSFYGNKDSSGENIFSISYDYLYQKFFVGTNYGDKKAVLNLSAFSDIWSGFSQNQVYIEISGFNIRATTANFAVRSVDSVSNLEENKIEDKNAPEITVDFGEYTQDNYPQGVKNCKYSIFGATAQDDFDGKAKVNAEVYYNYYSADKVRVQLQNGEFKPDRAGLYTVCYSAKDKSGNVAEELVDVVVKEFGNPIQLTIGDYNATNKVGEKITVAEVVADGGEGNKKILTKVYLGNEEVELEGNSFVPLKSGTYKVEYTAKDFVGQEKIASYQVVVELQTKPVFIDDVEKLLPEIFIVGESYQLAMPKVYLFNSDNTYSEIVPTVSVNNGTITNGVYTAENEGDVTIKYTVGSNGNTTEKTIVRKTYKIKTPDQVLDVKKLFIVDSGIQADYIGESKYTHYTTYSDNSMKYINEILTESFSMVLGFDANKNSASAVIVSLIDSEDSSKVLNVSINNIGGSAMVSVNGGDLVAIGADFNGSKDINISFANSTRILTINGIKINVSESFDGFINPYATLKVSFSGVNVSKGFALIVKEVGNQSLSEDNAVDIVAPMIVVLGDYSGNYKFGTVYNAPMVVAKDMISPSLQYFTMSVECPDGTYLELDGKTFNKVPVQEVSVLLNQYGSYVFSYYAKDTVGIKEARFSYSVNILDDTEPIIEIDDCDTEGKVGDTIDIAEITVIDEFDKAEDITVLTYLKTPDGKYVKLTAQSFKAEVAGRYVVYYYAQDAFGNITVEYYNINIEKE